MRLNDESFFKRLIIETSEKRKILEEYVEKDYWLVLLLKSIFANDHDYVFKGGTSLSKCFHLINRFSEDIDISYMANFQDLGSSHVNKRFKGIMKAVKENGLEINNKDKLRRSAFFNQFRCPYPTVFDETQFAKEIIIELAGQTPSFPTEKRKIQSFIGEYLESIGRNDLVEKYDLGAFEISVQKLERTVVDKTFALCDYYLTGKQRRHSRHIYDLSKILTKVELNEEIARLFHEVRKYRINNPVCPSSKNGVLLFELFNNIIVEQTYKNDFQTLTRPLLYEEIEYDDCVETLKRIQEFLKQYSDIIDEPIS